MAKELLTGKKGIIFGALDEKSLAWQIALKAKAEGAIFTLTNAPVAFRLGNMKELAKQCETLCIAADATNPDELTALFEQSMQRLGGKLDFILHAVGMSPNVRKKRDYTKLNYNFLAKTFDVSAFSLHKTLQTAHQLDALNEGASVVALTYIAAQRVFPGYGDMADAKAALESIARSFGYYYGKQKKVRINTVSQSPTPTRAGEGIDDFDRFYEYANKVAPLGNADAASCADFCVMLFSDYSRMITMQNIFHDGGFSSVGMSDALLFD